MTNKQQQEAVEPILEAIAERVVTLKLETPVQFLLEAHLPFVTLLHTAGIFIEPIAGPLVGAERIGAFNLILSDRSNIQELLRRIEMKLIAKDAAIKRE